MNYLLRQYLFGAVFLAAGLYQVIRTHYLEAAFYGFTGAAFITYALVREPKLAALKLPLLILAWVFILTAGTLFFYVLKLFL